MNNPVYVGYSYMTIFILRPASCLECIDLNYRMVSKQLERLWKEGRVDCIAFVLRMR
jgi:hypothetical protein